MGKRREISIEDIADIFYEDVGRGGGETVREREERKARRAGQVFSWVDEDAYDTDEDVAFVVDRRVRGSRRGGGS